MRPPKEALARIKLKVRELPAYFKARRRRWRPMPSQLHEQPARTISSATSVSSWAMSTRPSPPPTWCARRTYNCAEVCQNQMEMHAAVADYDAERDRMTVHASRRRFPYYVHLMLSQILGMDMSRIRVVKPHRRRRLRLPHGDAQCRTDRRAAGAQGRRLRAHR